MPQLFEGSWKNVSKACLEAEFGEGNRKELREHLQNVLRVRCGLDIPHALWRSAMCPFQHRCRHRENGKAGSPADLTCWVIEPKRTTALVFTFTVFYSTYFRILEKKRSLKQLFGSVWQSGSHNYTVLSKTSISRIPLLLFGQHQVPSQSTQHLRCSDPDRFFNYKLCFQLLALQCISQRSSGYLPKMPIHEKSCKGKSKRNQTQPCLRPIVARTCRCFDNSNNRNTIIWQFNILTWDIWKDYMADLGMNRMAKPIAWSALQRHFQSKHFAKRHPVTSLSAHRKRQSYLGETIGQMDQHEHCPLCLQRNQTKLASSNHRLGSLLRGITPLEPVFGKINMCCSGCKRVTYIESNISQTHLLARGPLELHVAHSVRPLLRWNKR